MEQNKIKAVIDPMGNVKLEGVVFSGTACDRAMAPLEKALAGNNMTRENKPEYNQLEQDQDQHDHMTWTG